MMHSWQQCQSLAQGSEYKNPMLLLFPVVAVTSISEAWSRTAYI